MRIATLVTIAAVGTAGVLSASIALGPHGAARAASFDCNQAAAPTEFAICGDPQLSQVDSEIGAAFDQRVATDPSIRQIQRGWLKVRNVGCGRNRGCLRPLMADELGWLRSGLRLSPALPASLGACSITTITRAYHNPSGIAGSGSSTMEANGAAEVSYEQIPESNSARRGDPALVCLVDMPRNCPPGDDRGKTYAIADLRTLGAWAAPDSEHMCGGA